MINIGVLVHSLTSEYSIKILNGITDFYKDKEVRLIIAQTRTPYADTTVYGYQCWTSTAFLNTPELDALIVLSGEYTSTISIPKFSLALNEYKKIPVISIGQELFLPKNYFTQVDCKSAYKDVITHLKIEHGCKKIGFFSANLTNSEEAIERFEAYKLGLLSNGLEYYNSLVIDGNFRGIFAHDEILRRYKKTEDVPFDAIICANDLTAYGCQTALQEIGVKIPEDIKIIGFDDSSRCVSTFPKISSMDQDLYTQGYTSAELAYKILTEKNVKFPRVTQTPVTPVFRQSCGCIPLDNKDDVVKMLDGRICSKIEHEKNRQTVSHDFNDYLHEMQSIYILFDLVKSDNTMRRVFYTLPYLMDNSEISQSIVCLYDSPVRLKLKEDFVLPKEMNISMLIDRETKCEIFEPEIHFNPHKKLIHEHNFPLTRGNYIMQPIFSGELNYGYIFCKIKNNNFAAYSSFLRIIINAISQAFEYTETVTANKRLAEENLQLSQNNLDFRSQKRYDDFTRTLNRHGFLDISQNNIDSAIANGEKGLIIYADCNHLKEINDRFGKAVGDIAVKAMATVLTKAFRANDIVGRISGDEFAVVSSGLQYDHIEKTKQKIDDLCREISEEKNLPFLLTLSIGFSEFSLSNRKIRVLLNEASKNMNIEKKQFHSSSRLKIVNDWHNSQIQQVSSSVDNIIPEESNTSNGAIFTSKVFSTTSSAPIIPPESEAEAEDLVEELEEVLDLDDSE